MESLFEGLKTGEEHEPNSYFLVDSATYHSQRDYPTRMKRGLESLLNR
jgi:hypothetical protein